MYAYQRFDTGNTKIRIIIIVIVCKRRVIDFHVSKYFGAELVYRLSGGDYAAAAVVAEGAAEDIRLSRGRTNIFAIKRLHRSHLRR
jgi:hypothetical protein